MARAIQHQHPVPRLDPSRHVREDAQVPVVSAWHDLGPRLQWGRRWDWARRLRLAEPGFGRHSVYEYSEVAEKAMKRILPSYELFRCVTPGWDNSARRDSDGLVLLGSSPELYGAWLTRLITQATARPEGRRIVFVNAWNEWAEGNHLEPCQRWGRSYLEATRKSLLDSQPSALRLHGGTGG